MELQSRDAYLVVARNLKPVKGHKFDFPVYTVICDNPDEAIDYVMSLGFCFGDNFSIRAIHVGLVGGQKQLAAAP